MSKASEQGERHHPLRFAWQIDAERRFTLDCVEFTALAGPRTAAALGRTWDDLCSALGLDPEGQVGRALATRDTWSALTVDWPIGDGDERVTVELSGLPVFDRERNFCGYRGFGVCRDLARLNGLEERPFAGAAASPSEEALPAEPVPSPGEHAERPAPAPEPASVVPTPPPEPKTLSPLERRAFHELARRLTGRLTPADAGSADRSDADAAAASGAAKTTSEPPSAPGAQTVTEVDPVADAGAEGARGIAPILDRLPVGVLIYRLDHLIYANRAFLRWAGHATIEALAQAGGLDSLLIEHGAAALETGGDTPFAITSRASVPAEARLFQVPWQGGDSAFALVTMPATAAKDERTLSPPSPASAGEMAEGKDAQAEIAELHAILDTATDGVIVLDRELRIASANRSAQALFGYDAVELVGRAFIDLFAPESAGVALAYIEALNESGGVLNDGRDVIGRERRGGPITLFMTIGRLASGRWCALFRDLTPLKKAAEELIEARRRAEKQSAAKSEFLARVSHEVRDPLNAVIGFSEMMMEERFGPIGNDRYRQYLKDIRTSAAHMMSLVNDLLDLSKIEAGKLELSFAGVALNELTQQCVALMQPQANRARVIIRTSLAPKLPQVMADARSLRQIVLNLVSNSIKFTGAGGQVIVSTARTDAGEVVLHVRDTGIGMSEQEIATALEPFRQVATAGRAGGKGGTGGAGLGLPLTKALAEGNQARLRIDSKPNAGTLVEVVFPAERVVVG